MLEEIPNFPQSFMDRHMNWHTQNQRIPKLLINRAAENNSMMHVIDEHLLDLAADKGPLVEPGN